MVGGLWAEKYRPRALAQFIGHGHLVAAATSFVASRNMPHLLLIGPPGSGKTSFVLALASELYGPNLSQNFLELNASDERGIDVIRHKVKEFARTVSIGGTLFKIICLDECDALTKDAQHALRRIMERYVRSCRFVLTANYGSKIIEPLQSRCAIFRFRQLSQAELAQLATKVAETEGLALDCQAKQKLLELADGDARRLLNLLQAGAALSKSIDSSTLALIAASAEPSELADVLKTALSGRFAEAREALRGVLSRHGLSAIDALKALQTAIISLAIDEEHKLALISALAETDFRLTEGSDELIQLDAFLARAAALAKNKRQLDPH